MVLYTDEVKKISTNVVQPTTTQSGNRQSSATIILGCQFGTTKDQLILPDTCSIVPASGWIVNKSSESRTVASYNAQTKTVTVDKEFAQNQREGDMIELSQPKSQLSKTNSGTTVSTVSIKPSIQLRTDNTRVYLGGSGFCFDLSEQKKLKVMFKNEKGEFVECGYFMPAQ